MERPANLPHGRWLADLADEKPLSAFERALVEACAKGQQCAPKGWDGKRPPADSKSRARIVRAELIRFLALGGDAEHPVHEEGVMLNGARITGELSLHQAQMPVRINLRLCRLDHAPNLTAAKIPELGLTGSWLPGLRADRIAVTGSMFLGGDFEAIGEFRMLGAQIGGSLNCSGGKFHNPGGDALNADRAKVTGGVFLNDGFEAAGEVRVLGADIGGALNCNNGTFLNPDGDALSADGVTVTGDVFLGRGFEATGQVRLLGVRIGGDLTCVKGKFNNPKNHALNADRMKVNGGVFLSGGFEATGQVRLLSAEIGGDLSCLKGKFRNPKNTALAADGVVVTGNLFLSDEFEADGEVRLLGLQIGGSLFCNSGTFNNPGGDAISADRMTIAGSLFLRRTQINGAFGLSAATVSTLIDEQTCWEAGDHILDGLRYDRIAGSTNAATRIAWLQRQRADHLGEDFRPQPWEQLIKVLRDMGHPNEARLVAIAKQDALRKAGRIGPWPPQPRKSGWGAVMDWLTWPFDAAAAFLTRVAHRFYGLVSGYGFRVNRLVLLLLLIGVGFGIGYQQLGVGGAVCPIAPKQVEAKGGPKKPPPAKCRDHPSIPWRYSADAMLPIDFGLIDKDVPISTIGPVNERDLGLVRTLTWTETLIGWLLSGLLIAIAGRLIKKD